MRLHRFLKAGWIIGAVLIALSWIRVVDSQIGWIGFWIACGASLISRVRFGGETEYSRLQREIAELDHTIAVGTGTLSENLLHRGITKYEAARFEDAIIDIDAALDKGVTHASSAMSYRGSANHNLRHFDEAIADYTEAIESASEADERIYHLRAFTYFQLAQFEQAINDYDDAIGLSPNSVELLDAQAMSRYVSGDFRGAVIDYESVLQLDPQHYPANHGLAAILACCPSGDLRDGVKAVEHAARACDASSWRDWKTLSVLAAACAEAGDFRRAVKYARKSCRLALAEEKDERTVAIRSLSRTRAFSNQR
jgi:tetratricopeptide (TPR) repeat protein